MPIFLLLLSLFASRPAPAPPVPVRVEVTSTRPASGDILLAVYANEADFAAERETFATVTPYRTSATLVDVDLPRAGTYVIAAFHDLNGNGDLDRNFFGIPTEPYGFVKAPPSKWTKPAFGDVASELGPGSQTKISLRTWKEY